MFPAAFRAIRQARAFLQLEGWSTLTIVRPTSRSGLLDVWRALVPVFASRESQLLGGRLQRWRSRYVRATVSACYIFGYRRLTLPARGSWGAIFLSSAGGNKVVSTCVLRSLLVLIVSRFWDPDGARVPEAAESVPQVRMLWRPQRFRFHRFSLPFGMSRFQ